MKLNELPRLPLGLDRSLAEALTRTFRETSQKVNQLASGRVAGFDEASTDVPSTGSWAIGDYVKKSNPVEAGSVGSKYVIKGWIRITDGSANVLNTDWLEDRALTGN